MGSVTGSVGNSLPPWSRSYVIYFQCWEPSETFTSICVSNIISRSCTVRSSCLRVTVPLSFLVVIYRPIFTWVSMRSWACQEDQIDPSGALGHRRSGVWHISCCVLSACVHALYYHLLESVMLSHFALCTHSASLCTQSHNWPYITQSPWTYTLIFSCCFNLGRGT